MNMALLLNTKKQQLSDMQDTIGAATVVQTLDAENCATQSSTTAPKTKLKRGRKPKGMVCVQ